MSEQHNTLEDLLEISEPYCVDFDFEPAGAFPDEMAWTYKGKWFCSSLAIIDIKELLCLS